MVCGSAHMAGGGTESGGRLMRSWAFAVMITIVLALFVPIASAAPPGDCGRVGCEAGDETGTSARLG